MRLPARVRLVSVLTVLMCGSNVDAGAQVLAQFSFEEDADVDAWRSHAADAKLTITRDPANVRVGTGALQLSYEPAQEAYFIIETGVLDVAGAQSLCFCVKCSETTPLLYGVAEEDGSSYDGFLQCSPNEWVDVRVNLADLQLREDSDDENEALDADQIRSLLFFDLSNLPGDVGRALGWKQGPQAMWLDNVVISADAAPSRSRIRDVGGGQRQAVLDDFESGLAFGLAIGGAHLAIVREAGGHFLRIRYGAVAEQWQGFVFGVGHVGLTGLQRVSLRAKATQTARLGVVLEERDGSKYEFMLDLQAGDWQEYALPVTGFAPDPGTIDENEALDPDQLRVMILLVDTFDSDVGADGTAEVSVDDLTAVCGSATRMLGAP